MAAPQRGHLTKPMPAPTRLCYFDFSGLGEPCRYMLAYCGETFIDDRMSYEQFAERKTCFPYEKVPYLEIDGLFLHQSLAICLYLARKHGISGNTAESAVHANMMAHTIEDTRAALARYFWESDPAQKEAKKEKAIKDANFYLDKLEAEAKYNGGTLVKEEFTWADVILGSMADYFNHMAGSDVFASRPTLAALRDRVKKHEGVAKYLATKPNTF